MSWTADNTIASYEAPVKSSVPTTFMPENLRRLIICDSELMLLYPSCIIAVDGVAPTSRWYVSGTNCNIDMQRLLPTGVVSSCLFPLVTRGKPIGDTETLTEPLPLASDRPGVRMCAIVPTQQSPLPSRPDSFRFSCSSILGKGHREALDRIQEPCPLEIWLPQFIQKNL